MSLPVLSSERVSLVPVSHAVAYAVLAGQGLDAALAPLTAAPDWPHADTPDALRPLAEYGAPGDDGGWLVVLGSPRDGTVVGDCGWLGGPAPGGDVEIGYGLAPSARGQGLGTEAVAVLCTWAAAQPGVTRLTADVLPGNEASLRLLRRLGFAQAAADEAAASYAGPYLRMVR
ncbi:MAG: GNAT family N-acetyltransferase [Mycobacteriales bacterium]|nr:GNAT family N-acetyltransferase [Mycobacteriales bacterium]